MTDADDRRHAYRPGGMMRCCILTVALLTERAAPDPKAGDKIKCSYCGGILTHDGESWGWEPEREETK